MPILICLYWGCEQAARQKTDEFLTLVPSEALDAAKALYVTSKP